jgi:hypothetical protein
MRGTEVGGEKLFPIWQFQEMAGDGLSQLYFSNILYSALATTISLRHVNNPSCLDDPTPRNLRTCLRGRLHRVLEKRLHLPNQPMLPRKQNPDSADHVVHA